MVLSQWHSHYGSSSGSRRTVSSGHVSVQVATAYIRRRHLLFIQLESGRSHFVVPRRLEGRVSQLNPLMHEVAVLFQICSEVMSSLGNHSSWLHSFK